jgi:Ca-activated chloride channel family protein
VLLLTDGLANQGVTDPEVLRDAAARYRSQGVSTSTFGLGADFDEELLTSMASAGGGHFYFIEQAQQIPDLLASELGEVLDIVARDVAFEVAAGDGVSVVVMNALPVEQTGSITRVRLGDLVSEQEVTLLLAISCDARAEGARASVNCRVTDRGQVLFPEPMLVEWTAVPADQDRQQPANHAVLTEVARMLAERARVQALGANRKGDYQHASLALDTAAGQIGQLGMDDEVVQAIVQPLLGEKDVFASHMDPMERKSRHFASYGVAYSREAGKARKRGDK